LQFLLENGKNAPFHKKSPVKIFMVGPKGHRTVVLPLNTPLICSLKKKIFSYVETPKIMFLYKQKSFSF